jgi:3(or 17)beta-hydroxysteroid dehydrogenase
MRLKGKVAIITGGAHGMGAVEAVLFAKEGAKVVIADIREEDARKVEAEIAEVGGEAMVALLDVTKDNQWERTIADVVARFGKLDILVNNAGISGSGEKDFGSSQAWDQLMDVNAKSVFLGMKHAIPEMEKAGGGAIVNISSISGMVGQSYIHPGYNASKGAVRLVTKAAAVQHAKSGIRVNSVHPGSMPPMLTSGARGDGGSQDARMAAIPMGREGQPIEVANAVLFMASDEASYITGTELMVDGGYTAK